MQDHVDLFTGQQGSFADLQQLAKKGLQVGGARLNLAHVWPEKKIVVIHNLDYWQKLKLMSGVYQ